MSVAAIDGLLYFSGSAGFLTVALLSHSILHYLPFWGGVDRHTDTGYLARTSHHTPRSRMTNQYPAFNPRPRS
jgi:hypothetical protein